MVGRDFSERTLVARMAAPVLPLLGERAGVRGTDVCVNPRRFMGRTCLRAHLVCSAVISSIFSDGPSIRSKCFRTRRRQIS